MTNLRASTVPLALTCALLLIPVLATTQIAAANPGGVADGKTAILTPEGTWIVPPPGAPLAIAPRVDAAAERVLGGSPWGFGPAPASPALGLGSCANYRAGWYETTSANLWGGHAGIVPQALPVVTTDYCAGMGMGYSDGIDFGGSNWIQAGIVTFPGETGAKWMCQSNLNGQLTTLYGSANQYSSASTVYTWFSRDSSGVWRTYRYDTGPYSIELGCTISHGDSGAAPLQVFGEIQGAAGTSAPMGPWKMFDLRYESNAGSWFAPAQLQAHYASGTPCPPYGAGVVSKGAFVAGSGQACSTGTSPYPN